MKRVLMGLLLLLAACGSPGVPAVPAADGPTPTVANDEQMIRDAAVAFGNKLGQTGPFQVAEITVDGDYAFGRLTVVGDTSLDPLAVFFKRESGEWSAITGGTSFDSQELASLGVPRSLWDNVDVVEALPTDAPADPVDPSELGSIAGTLGYPSDTVPALDVYVVDANDASNFVTLRTLPGQQEFVFSYLPAGTYVLMAFLVDSDAPFGGGHSACAAGAPCEAHMLEPVTLEPGGGLTGIAVDDWQITDLPAPPTGAPMPTREP